MDTAKLRVGYRRGRRIYTASLPFSIYGFPTRRVERIKHHRKVSSALLVGLVAIAIAVGSKFPREPATRTTQNIPLRTRTASTTVAAKKWSPAPRRSIGATTMRTQPPAPRPPHKSRAIQAPRRLWRPMAEQQDSLLGLIVQTPRAKDGVWLSQIVERVNAGDYDGMPGPNAVEYPATLRKLAMKHRVKILGTTESTLCPSWVLREILRGYLVPRSATIRSSLAAPGLSATDRPASVSYASILYSKTY